MDFFLGAHHANWLSVAKVPLFVSRRTLFERRHLPRAAAFWALDSGGFTELSLHGAWTLSPREYVREIYRYSEDIGMLDWAAPQDWMCEPAILRRTGLTVEQHQARTIANYLELRALDPDLPIIPVLQGWSGGDYWRHAEAYEAAGVPLSSTPLVGIGSVCRRQNTVLAGAVIATLCAERIALHGFGFKVSGLRSSGHLLASADSMAWSLSARKNPPLEGHKMQHQSCANCFDYAMAWRSDLLASLGQEKT